MATEHALHLSNILIEGFRGIDSLCLPRLGRVTLLAGKNSIGKTTVLDAVDIYAARANYPALATLLFERDEVSDGADDDGDTLIFPDWLALFHNRHLAKDARILIGPKSPDKQLVITPGPSRDIQYSMLGGRSSEDVQIQSLTAKLGTDQAQTSWTIFLDPQHPYRSRRVHRRRRSLLGQSSFLSDEGEPPPKIDCEFIGPGRLSNIDLARLWDSVALTDDEDRSVKALQLVFGSDLERVGVIGDELQGRRGRRAVARLKSQIHPVPLRSLGDGALRLFSVALALANSRGGFLLVDEAENGIHYSLQRDYWNMVLRTANENDVQVIATTHSSDCVRGFAQASRDFEDSKGVLLRLSRQDGDLRAIEYPEEELVIAAEQGIEVR